MSGAEYYVYYKLRPAQAAAAQAAFAALLPALPAGVRVRLLQRSDAAPAQGAELLTWMEIYQGPSAQALALAEQRVAAALAPFVEGARHLEHFAPLALTAP